MNILQMSDSTMNQVAIGSLMLQRATHARAIGGNDSTWNIDRLRKITAALYRHGGNANRKKK